MYSHLYGSLGGGAALWREAYVRGMRCGGDICGEVVYMWGYGGGVGESMRVLGT